MLAVRIVLWDADTDRTIVFHDGVQVWSDSLAYVDQYLRHILPQNEPITIEVT